MAFQYASKKPGDEGVPGSNGIDNVNRVAWVFNQTVTVKSYCPIAAAGDNNQCPVFLLEILGILLGTQALCPDDFGLIISNFEYGRVPKHFLEHRLCVRRTP